MNIEEIVDVIKKGYKYKILEDSHTNVECDLCGKDLYDKKSYIVCICPTEKCFELWEDDPLSNDVIILGSECLKKVKHALKEETNE